MNAKERKLSIIYRDHPLILDPSELATLAVFYDEIYLPHPFGLDQHSIDFIISANHLKSAAYKYYEEWHRTTDLLFKQGVLKTLPPVYGSYGADFMFDEMRTAWNANYDPSTASPKDYIDFLAWFDSNVSYCYSFLLGQSYSSIPNYFTLKSSDPTTSILAGRLIRSLFYYQFPQLKNLTAEQILEVREYLKDTKEGFAAYINEMVDDVEARLKDGARSEDLAALNTVERKILPKYYEFCRQLKAKNTGFWSKVLEAGGKFLKIDATPFSPKFYGETIQILFELLGKEADEDLKNTTNEQQAFMYLATLHSKSQE